VKVVLDTNVIISGIFFTGPPYDILDAWRHGDITLVTSLDILDEYRKVAEELAVQFPAIEWEPVMRLLTLNATIVDTPSLPETVCADPSDDKFLACAIAGGVRHIVSGDRHLLAVSGYAGVTVIRPRKSVDTFLQGGAG
jgi:putative PIN family toxin of toxin-antitoxin system